MGHFSALPEGYVSTCLSTTGKMLLIAGMVVFFAIIFLVVLIHLYLRWSVERSHRRNRALIVTSLMNLPELGNSGLDQSVIRSLPTFTVAAAGAEKDDLECAICLSAFKLKEIGRLLPECNHQFHVACIDMWFQSHSTCPICRTLVRHWHSPSNVASINVDDFPASETPPVDTVASPSDFGVLTDQASGAVSSAEFSGEQSERSVEHLPERQAVKCSSENPLMKLKRMLSREKGRSSSSLQACDLEGDVEAAGEVGPPSR